MERKTFKATKNTTMPTSGGCTTSPAEVMFAIVLAAVDRLVVYKHFLVVELKVTVLSLISGLHVINSFNFPASLVIETSGFLYELYIHLLMDKEFRLEVFFL